MTGGLLNLISYGAANVILNGNASYTVFKQKYKKHTNFGLQKFRIDYKGQRQLQTSTETVMEFTIPRYGDLIWDTYVVITLPDIYSSVYWNKERTNSEGETGSFVPYEFRWVEELGATMIREVEVMVGSATLGKYSGEYLSILNARDNTGPRSELWNHMTGNVDELHNPAYVNGRMGVYPTVVYLEDQTSTRLDPEPSIRSRQLFIPIEPWFGGHSHMAFPLVALQNQEMKIRIRLRPVSELCRVRNVVDPSSNFAYTVPNQNVPEFQIQRFLYPPTDISSTAFNGISIDDPEFSKMPETWNADIHLLATYVFVEKDEQTWFAGKEQTYLIQDVFEYEFHHVQGTNRIRLDTRDCVSNLMWRFRRDDVSTRNEWMNYTNWEYQGVQPAPPMLDNPYAEPYLVDASYQSVLVNTYANLANWEITGNTLQTEILHTQPPSILAGSANQKHIMVDMGMLMDGKYRENVFSGGVYQYVDAYARGNRLGGNSKDGVYLYSFATQMQRHALHPTGAMNMNKFTRFELEFTTILPPVTTTPPYENICEVDEEGNSVLIGVRKNPWKQYQYGYDLRVFEERYNLLRIMGGTAGFLFAR